MLSPIVELVQRLSDVVTLPTVGSDSAGIVVRMIKGTQIAIVGDLSGLIANNTLLGCTVWLTARSSVAGGNEVVIYKDSRVGGGVALAVTGTGGVTQKFTVTLSPTDTVYLDRDQYSFDIRLQLASSAGPYVLCEGVLNLRTAIGEQSPRT